MGCNSSIKWAMAVLMVIQLKRYWVLKCLTLNKGPMLSSSVDGPTTWSLSPIKVGRDMVVLLGIRLLIRIIKVKSRVWSWERYVNKSSKLRVRYQGFWLECAFWQCSTLISMKPCATPIIQIPSTAIKRKLLIYRCSIICWRTWKI